MTWSKTDSAWAGLLLFAVFGHGLAAMRRVYHLSWAGAWWRGVLVSLGYLLLQKPANGGARPSRWIHPTLIQQALDAPHTRLPLYRDEAENIIGVLHAKDLLKALAAEGLALTIDQLAAQIKSPDVQGARLLTYSEVEARRKNLVGIRVSPSASATAAACREAAWSRMSSERMRPASTPQDSDTYCSDRARARSTSWSM
mgnify:CR=1 FL=1